MLRILASVLMIAFPTLAAAQSAEPNDHRIVYAVGWAGDWSRDAGFHPVGASLGIEVTPIEHWLSIETSIGAHHGDDGTEVPIEVAFRKPWQLSRRVEFMAGVAPEIIHSFGAQPDTYAGASFGAHVMVWPRRNLGWYAESAYEVTFPRDGTQKGIGISVGMLIGR